MSLAFCVLGFHNHEAAIPGKKTGCEGQWIPYNRDFYCFVSGGFELRTVLCKYGNKVFDRYAYNSPGDTFQRRKILRRGLFW